MRHFTPNLGKKKKLVIFGGIIILLCAIVAVTRLVHPAGNQGTAARLQTTVDAASVQRADLVKHISLTGQTVPAAQVDIAAKYQGKVVAVNAVLGQQVTPGEVLVVQDTGDAELTIGQNQAAYSQAVADAIASEATVNANYDKAKADYRKALATYQRNKTVYDVGGISLDELELSEQQLADAKASLDSLTNQMSSGVPAAVQSSRAAAQKMQIAVSAAQKQKNDLIITAPRAGVIGYRQAEVGDMVAAGQKLISIFDNSRIYVDCQVPEQDLGALKLGLALGVQIESLGKTFPGKIIYISPAADSQNLVFTARIELDNPGNDVRSGMFSRVAVDAPLRQGVLIVPKEAVQEKDGQSFVFVIGQGNVIEKRIVEIGARSDQNIEILSGLNEGEQIAATNLARLRPNMIVAVRTPGARGDSQ
ncbi:efflux RND transporter periplasmic adaptor subunit [Sporomusa acidovorans]|uniref:Multidrug resistance protein MdtE n=1 Tax=Sporomusa acidovorans (strain ATCC 49682 / DSM 3132 / Mol) TaxID=1123286 RepID=A0ABZ3J7G7_SPOA4|nr:efflux RND transporter periplasmic adaptor subunit [Sporomusa acidovorans]OZC21281.1 multidrug resistance protein MdtE precursor [Sporomusa acidovorans DSM 3132]SDE66879.1 RND family efflux transporter, MFP subunit [Sporomusa acidovorans]